MLPRSSIHRLPVCFDSLPEGLYLSLSFLYPLWIHILAAKLSSSWYNYMLLYIKWAGFNLNIVQYFAISRIKMIPADHFPGSTTMCFQCNLVQFQASKYALPGQFTLNPFWKRKGEHGFFMKRRWMDCDFILSKAPSLIDLPFIHLAFILCRHQISTTNSSFNQTSFGGFLTLSLYSSIPKRPWSQSKQSHRVKSQLCRFHGPSLQIREFTPRASESESLDFGYSSKARPNTYIDFR